MEVPDLVSCPVCTLYLRNGITLQNHLKTHPKNQVIQALLQVHDKKPAILPSPTFISTSQPSQLPPWQTQRQILPPPNQTFLVPIQTNNQSIVYQQFVTNTGNVGQMFPQIQPPQFVQVPTTGLTGYFQPNVYQPQQFPIPTNAISTVSLGYSTSSTVRYQSSITKPNSVPPIIQSTSTATLTDFTEPVVQETTTYHIKNEQDLQKNTNSTDCSIIKPEIASNPAFQVKTTNYGFKAELGTEFLNKSTNYPPVCPSPVNDEETGRDETASPDKLLKIGSNHKISTIHLADITISAAKLTKVEKVDQNDYSGQMQIIPIYKRAQETTPSVDVSEEDDSDLSMKVTEKIEVSKNYLKFSDNLIEKGQIQSEFSDKMTEKDKYSLNSHIL